MNEHLSDSSRGGSKSIWAGRILSGLMCLLFAASAAGKLAGGQSVAENMAHLDFPDSLTRFLVAIELACVVIYAIPRTAVLGAILLAGYMGGAICAHLRVGDVPVPQLVIGVLVWLGVYLRDERLRTLLPIR